MKQQHLEDREALKKLNELLSEVKVCMFATVKDDYTVHSRPMQTIQADADGTLWFFTNEFSGKVKEISKDNTVYLMYADPSKNTYVHLKGKCEIVDDKEKMKELWSPMVKAWFPKGLEDPALALLSVQTEEASYWDGPSSKLVVLYEMVKSIATGDTPDTGESGKLNVS